MKKIFIFILFPVFVGAMDKQRIGGAPAESLKAPGAAPTEKTEREFLNADFFLAQFRDMRYYHLKIKIKDADGNKCSPYKDLLFTAIQFALLHQHKLWPTENFKPIYDEKWTVEAIYIHRAQQRIAEIVEEVCPSSHGFLESMQILSQEITDKYIERFWGEGPWTLIPSRVPNTKPEQTLKEAAMLKTIIGNFGDLTGVGLNEMIDADLAVSRRITEKASVLIAGTSKDGKLDPKYEAILKQMNFAGAQ